MDSWGFYQDFFFDNLEGFLKILEDFRGILWDLLLLEESLCGFLRILSRFIGNLEGFFLILEDSWGFLGIIGDSFGIFYYQSRFSWIFVDSYGFIGIFCYWRKA